MAFDQATRNRLARFVSEARNLLTEEFTRQLQHEYGLDPTSGTVTRMEKLSALDDARWETGLILRETMQYYLGGGPEVPMIAKMCWIVSCGSRPLRCSIGCAPCGWPRRVG